MTQTHNNDVHYPVTNSRSEGLVTANSSLFDFQPHLRPPSSFYIGQTELSELSELSMPGLTIGQEPKVEPVSEQDLGLSASSLIYTEIMSRLPQI